MRPHARGFTLVELLVAVAIAALVLLAAGTAYSALIRAEARNGEAVERLRTAEGFMERLDRALRGAMPSDPLRGGPSSVSFVTSAFRGGRPVGVHVAAGEPPEPARYGEAVPPGAEPVFTEVPEVTGLHFRFRDGKGAWRETWEGDGLPRAVSIDFRVGGEDFGTVVEIPCGAASGAEAETGTAG